MKAETKELSSVTTNSDWTDTGDSLNLVISLLNFQSNVLESDKTTYEAKPILFDITNIDGFGSDVKCWLELNYLDGWIIGSTGIFDNKPDYNFVQMVMFEIKYNFTTETLEAYEVVFYADFSASGAGEYMTVEKYSKTDGRKFLCENNSTYEEYSQQVDDKLESMLNFDFEIFDVDMKAEYDAALV